MNFSFLLKYSRLDIFDLRVALRYARWADGGVFFSGGITRWLVHYVRSLSIEAAQPVAFLVLQDAQPIITL